MGESEDLNLRLIFNLMANFQYFDRRRLIKCTSVNDASNHSHKREVTNKVFSGVVKKKGLGVLVVVYPLNITYI